MSKLESAKKSEIVIAGPDRPGTRDRARFARATFTDEQLEMAGARGSVSLGRATVYDYCPTKAGFCTTYGTTCPQGVSGPSPN